MGLVLLRVSGNMAERLENQGYNGHWEFGAGACSWKKQRAQPLVISPNYLVEQARWGGRRALQGSFAQS